MNRSALGRLKPPRPNLTRNDLALGLLSAALFAASFPPLNFYGLIWVSLIPFLLRLETVHGLYSAAVYGLVVGYVSCLAVIWWLSMVTVPGVLLLAVWTAFPWVVTAMLACWARPGSVRGLLLLPAAWTLAEWLRAQGYTSFAWCQLAHPLWKDEALLPLVSIAGTWGLTWLVCLASVGLSLLMRTLLPPLQRRRPANRRAGIACGSIAVFLIPFTAYVFTAGLKEPNQEQGWRPLRVAAVQGNIGLDDKHAADWQDYLERYRTLSLEAAQRGAELIVWPETTVVHPPRYWYSVTNHIQGIVDEVGRGILVGAVDCRGLELEDSEQERYYNAVMLWTPGAVEPQISIPCAIDHLPRYEKRHLVPFGETVPFGDYWPFSLLESVVERAGGGIFEPGTEATVFEGPGGVRFGVGICFESSLESEMAVYRDRGAQFLVVVTNDAWFGRTPGPEQHLVQSIFRAAENSLPVVRAANTGITALIDYNGKIIDQLPTHEAGVLVGDIQLPIVD